MNIKNKKQAKGGTKIAAITINNLLSVRMAMTWTDEKVCKYDSVHSEQINRST